MYVSVIYSEDHSIARYFYGVKLHLYSKVDKQTKAFSRLG